MKTIAKKIQMGLILIGLGLSPYALAAQQSPPEQGNIADQIKQFFQAEQQENAKVQRELFQDMKNFMGLTQLKSIETQNVMRLMLPPHIDKTMAVGARILAAEQSMQPWLDTLVRDTANYNIHTPEADSDSTGVLTARLETVDLNNLLNPYQDLDDLLASTLLNGLAFQDDKQAEDAYMYIRRLTNFTPLAPLPDDEFYTDSSHTNITQAGVDHVMQVYKQMPSLTLAQNSLLAIHAEKQRFEGFAKDLPIGKDGNASLMEVLAYEVERRYMSADWYNEMNQMSEAGLLREIANQMAFQSYLSYKDFERNQRMEAMMAAQIGTMSGFSSILSPTPPTEIPTL